MYKPLKHLFTGLIILLTISSAGAQSRTYSTFSRYGFGELNTRGLGINDAMGGSGIGIRTNDRLNILNPASYTAMDSMSFFFDVGLSSNTQTISNSLESNTFSDINFDYFTLGFPVSQKVALTVGVRPAAQAGYNYESPGKITEPSLNTAIGAGNFTNLYGGIGIKVTPQLSIGADASFWFGDIYHKSYVDFIESQAGPSYGIKNEHTISSLLLDFGMQYTKPLTENQSLTIGVVFSPQMPLNGQTSLLTANGNQFGTEKILFTTNDTIQEKTKEIDWADANFKMPAKFGFGLSYQIKDKLILAADYSMTQWGSVDFPDDVTVTADASKLAFGAEWIPNQRTGTKYYQRIHYRTGIHYNNDYLKFGGNQLKDFGVSFGLGLPLGRSKTSINIGYEYGQKGTFEADALKETYQRISFSMNMHEAWFFKRKIE